MIPFEQIDPIDPGGGGDGGGGGEFIPASLPGLGGILRRRYTLNLILNEELPVIDAINGPINITSRQFITQGYNGKVRLHNKRPVDWAQGIGAFDVGDTVLECDDVSAWIDDLRHYILIDPHTDESEVRTVTDADYDAAQNSVALTSSHPVDIAITGFSGCDGDSTPATAVITVTSFTAGVQYDIGLDGYTMSFIPGVSDTIEGIASFLAGMILSHPALYRRFRVISEITDNFLTLKGKFGTLTVNEALAKTHIAPEADPTAAPVLTVAAGPLDAGDVRVAYAFKNEHGQTLLSPFKSEILTGSQQINVGAIAPPTDCTVVWYASAKPGGSKLRFLEENSGAAFSITQLPLLDDALPPDLNRTGTEIMRIKGVFSDRQITRSQTERSNVLRGTFDWFLGKRNKRYNVVEFKYRDQGQDYRLVTLRLKDRRHIAKVHKEEKLEVNGQGVDNFFQAYRLAAGILGEQQEADFNYSWDSTKLALLYEEGDVVAITDNGSGVINFPVWIEEMIIDPKNGGMPTIKFTGRKYANSLWDDSVVERTIPIIVEYEDDEGEMPPLETYFMLHGSDFVTFEGDRVIYPR